MNPPSPDPDFPPSPSDSAGQPEPEPTPDPPPYVYPGTGRPFPPRRPAVDPRAGGRLPNLTTPVWRNVLVGVLLATAFFLGVFVDRAGYLPRPADREPANVVHTFGPYWEAWNLVHENYVDQKSVDNVKMTRFSISGMLDALGDEGHTTYLSPEDVKREQDSLQGHMEGIGARITIHDRLPTILMTMSDSPARKSGLKAGDVLLAVDGKSVAQQPLQQVVDQVRGAAGTQVVLTVHRDQQSEPVQVPITRGKVNVPDVTWHMLPGEPYAHVALESFGEHADDQLRVALKAALAAGAKGVIFDLRGNPGGYKDQAVKVTSEFLKSGNVFIEVDVHGDKNPVPVEPGGMATDIPLVVLIDGGTASAAEICSGALQDYKRAPLVGQKTFGTGTVLEPFKLSDGSEVLLATLKWLTPDGHEIWHHGIEPDVKVALQDQTSALLPEMEDDLTPAAFQKTGDAQLLKALEILREKTKAPEK